MTAHQKKVAAYQAVNRETAQMVLANVPYYGGEGSLMVRSARLVAANAGDRATAEKGLPLWRTA